MDILTWYTRYTKIADSGTLPIKSLMDNEWKAADPMDFRAKAGWIVERKKNDG